MNLMTLPTLRAILYTVVLILSININQYYNQFKERPFIVFCSCNLKLHSHCRRTEEECCRDPVLPSNHWVVQDDKGLKHNWSNLENNYLNHVQWYVHEHSDSLVHLWAVRTGQWHHEVQEGITDSESGVPLIVSCRDLLMQWVFLCSLISSNTFWSSWEEQNHKHSICISEVRSTALLRSTKLNAISSRMPTRPLFVVVLVMAHTYDYLDHLLETTG